MTTQLPFPEQKSARADLKPGTLYAIDGGDKFIYYGQITADRATVGFFRHRGKTVNAEKALAAPILSRFSVSRPSIGRALKAGKWLNLGRHELREELNEEPVLVQCPEGTLEVTLWKGDKTIGTRRLEDPAIQHLEIIAVYDALEHVPERLQADYNEGASAWKAGGTVRRERLLKEDFARRFPTQAWHQLPPGWVAVK